MKNLVIGTMSSVRSRKRRNQNLNYVQPEVQVLAECAFFDGLAEILVGGRNHAQIEVDVLQAAQPPEGLLFEHAQQLGLQHERDLADFVEEQRALVGQFEDAAFLRSRVGERALLVAEQLAFQQGFRNGRAVDGDERLGLAQALVVERFGDQVFAGSVLAFEQDGGGFAGGHAPHEIHHLAHGRAIRRSPRASGAPPLR